MLHFAGFSPGWFSIASSGRHVVGAGYAENKREIVYVKWEHGGIKNVEIVYELIYWSKH